MKSRKKGMNGSGKRRWPWVIAAVFVLVGLWQLVTSLYPEQEKALRRQLREKIKDTFPEETAVFSKTLGLVRFDAGREVSEEAAGKNKAVVLVHGLDDPGEVWNSLAPRLVKEGFRVWIMNYPNDQPIRESARLFFGGLKELKQVGIPRISIVAHSMGGLVSRELLTSPEFGYSQALENSLVPEVAALVMVGTPNHGSQLARFRLFVELRDHITQLRKGEANWLGTILDGAGEAKIDLLPGSLFLTELNARPHPQGVEMLIIAGITSPWNDSDIDRGLRYLRQKVPEETQKQVDTLGSALIAMTHGLGDGLVTVESTRLDKVPHRTVDGTHLSIIRNILNSSQRTPPAVPIIVKFLEEKG